MLLQKILSKIIFYSSLVFIVVYLYSNDDFENLEINSIGIFILSIILLLLAFLFQNTSWYLYLNSKQINVKAKEVFKAQFVHIFSKYIPGKVATILAPANDISLAAGASVKKISFLLTQLLLFNIWLSFLIASLAIPFLNITTTIKLTVSIIFIAITIFLFSDFFHTKLQSFFIYVFKKEVRIPRILFRDLKYMFLLNFLMLFCWVLAFSLFSVSISEVDFNLSYGIMFIVSIALGILALVSPGGLGVREAILSGLLVSCGISIENSVLLAVSSRVWFLIAEMLMFVLGIIVSKVQK